MKIIPKSLLTLPIAPLDLILQELSWNDLKKCCLVSKGFYDLITDSNQKIDSRIILKIPPTWSSISAGPVLLALLHFKRVFIELSVQCEADVENNRDLLMELIQKLGPNIKNIAIENFPKELSTTAFFELVPNMESATVIKCFKDNTETDANFIQLKQLVINKTAISVFNQTKGLEYFEYEFGTLAENNLGDIEQMSKNMMKTLFKNQATISTLVVKGRSLFDFDAYDEVKLTKLRSLTIPKETFSVVSDDLQFHLLSNHKNLENLVIGLGHFTSSNVINCFMSMQNLKYLEIISEYFSEFHFFKNSQSSTIESLKYSELFGFSNLDVTRIGNFCKYFIRLTFLF